MLLKVPGYYPRDRTHRLLKNRNAAPRIPSRGIVALSGVWVDFLTTVVGISEMVAGRVLSGEIGDAVTWVVTVVRAD
jgi:hypothetical protein